MKKLVYLLIALVLVFALAGCDEFLETPPTESTPTMEATEEPTTQTTVEIPTQETTEATEADPYPMQITSADYSGPECWLLAEPSATTSEVVFDVYVDIDTAVDGWHDQVKSVIALLWSQYSDNEKFMFKIYNGTDGLDKKQPTYEDLIACWQNKPFSAITESKPTITWYPNGAGVAAQEETENWEP